MGKARTVAGAAVTFSSATWWASNLVGKNLLNKNPQPIASLPNSGIAGADSPSMSEEPSVSVCWRLAMLDWGLAARDRQPPKDTPFQMDDFQEMLMILESS